MSRTARGWTVAMAGLGINLALGVLYSWSIISKTLQSEYGWSAGQASLPYAIAVGVFAIAMVFAGRAQDKFGPRIVASVGGVLMGSGLMLCSLGTDPASWPIIVGFGLFAGTGIGLGYASATPAAVKWFPPQRKGLITGIVVAGFGLASVYIAPLTTWLVASFGLSRTFLVLGAAFLVAVVGIAQLLVNPPKDEAAAAAAANTTEPGIAEGEYTTREMMRTPQFYLMWVMYAFSAFAGLMIIGHMAKIAAAQVPSVTLGFLLVAVLAVGNASGRVVAGIVSDRLGGVRTMFLVFSIQAALMVALGVANTTWLLVLLAASVGFTYGANLSLFPSTTAGFFGTKHLGSNYGAVFTAWGVGGVFGSMAAGTIVDSTGNYGLAYIIAAGLSLLAAALTFATRPPSQGAAVVSAKDKRIRKAA